MNLPRLRGKRQRHSLWRAISSGCGQLVGGGTSWALGATPDYFRGRRRLFIDEAGKWALADVAPLRKRRQELGSSLAIPHSRWKRPLLTC